MPTPPAEQRLRPRGIRLVNSVLLRLFISYVSLIFLVSLGTSISSYLFYQSRYNEQLERLHHFVVDQMAETMVTRVADVTKLIYLECATELLRGANDLFGEDDLTAGNAVKVLATYNYLSTLRAKYRDVVAGITLYYRKADAIIGVPTGFHERDAGGVLAGSQEFDRFKKQGDRSTWSTGDQGVPVTLRSFPILSTPQTFSVIVAIQIEPSAIVGLLSRPDADGASYVIDDAGGVIASSKEAPDGRRIFVQFLKNTPVAADGTQSHILEVQGRPSLITAVPIADTGWMLANVTPLAILYHKSGSLRLILLLIAFSAILVGMAVAAVITAHIYNPLSGLIRRVRTLFGSSLPPPSGPTAAYRIIDSAIRDLSTRMDELSTTLLRNRPLIMHELATSLLEGDFQINSFESSLKLLGLSSFPSSCFAATVLIDSGEEAPGTAGPRVMRYRATDALERRADGPILTAALHDGSVGVISEYSYEGRSPAVLAEGWIRELKASGVRVAAICVGRVVSDPRELRLSYIEAQKRAEYRYFFPERTIYSEDSDVLPREGRAGELPESVLRTMADGLRRKNRSECESALREVVEFVRSDSTEAASCRRQLARFARAIVDVIADALPGAARKYRSEIEARVIQAADIRDFASAANEIISRFFADRERTSEQRSAVLLGEVKRLVERDLGGDLSLSRLGELIGVSPGHLGRVFRQETGVTIVDYVNERRLTEAAKLLVQTNQPVQEIGRDVGFNSPAYFINRFRGRYGQTPVEYRRANILEPSP